MAFCTSCGAQIDAAARFCTNCGAASGSSAPSRTSPAAVGSSSGAAAQPAMAAPAPKGGGGAFKVILGVLGVIFVLVVLAVCTVVYIGWRVAHRVRVSTSGDSATVSTPFGTVTSNTDAMQVARQLGVDVYPGARGQKDASAVSIGGYNVATATFESSDPPDKVADWYRAKYPKAQISTSDSGHNAIVATTSKGMVTIAIDPSGDGSRIAISNVGGDKVHGESN